jgi:hypothetical protein
MRVSGPVQCKSLGHPLTLAIRPCNRVSKSAELIGISGVWKGFFMTASASASHNNEREVEVQERKNIAKRFRGP